MRSARTLNFMRRLTFTRTKQIHLSTFLAISKCIAYTRLSFVVSIHCTIHTYAKASTKMRQRRERVCDRHILTYKQIIFGIFFFLFTFYFIGPNRRVTLFASVGLFFFCVFFFVSLFCLLSLSHSVRLVSCARSFSLARLLCTKSKNTHGSLLCFIQFLIIALTILIPFRMVE